MVPISQFPICPGHCLVKAHALSLRIPTMSSHFQSSHLQTHPLKSCQDSLSKPWNIPYHSVLKIHAKKSMLLSAFPMLSLPALNSVRWSCWGFALFLLLLTSEPVFKLWPMLRTTFSGHSPFVWLTPAQHFRLIQAFISSRSPSPKTPTLSTALVYISIILLFSLWYNYLCMFASPLDPDDRKWHIHLRLSIFVEWKNSWSMQIWI